MAPPLTLEAALSYTQRGWSVIPLHTKRKDGSCSCGKTCEHPGKHPRLPAWKEFQEQRPPQEQIKRWWRTWPDSNVGIICGRVSGGLTVLDIDDVALVERLLKSGLPKEAMLCRTPSGGLHIYLTESNGMSSSGSLLPGVADLKANGGYVVAPPSPGYTWMD